MTPAQLEIARRVAASPSFRWMEGMTDYEDKRVLRIERDHACVTDGDYNPRVTIPLEWMGLLVLTDPATLGCLHALACERWGAVQIWAVLTGAAPAWRAVDGIQMFAIRYPIPADILSAFPNHPHAAAVCAALLHEVTP